MEFSANRKGFLGADFTDRFGQECSIQESSYQEESCVWLGVDVDMEGKDLRNGRMLLTQDMARKLFPVLRHFARQGTLGVDNPFEKFTVGGWVVGVGPYNHGVEGRIVSMRKGETIVVQDMLRSGPEGQIASTWDQVDLIWEPIETPDSIPSWFDHLRAEADDEEDEEPATGGV